MAKRWKKQEITYLKRYAEKRTLAELAERFGTEPTTVTEKLRDLELEAKDWRDTEDAAPDPMVAHLERALKAMYDRRWSQAARQLERVVEGAGDLALVARAKEYLTACRAHLDEEQGESQDAYLEAVVHRNEGRLDEALEIATAGGRRSDDRFLYLAAAIKALQGELDGAAEDLARAIEKDPRHRFHARVDSDFEALRESDEYAELFAEE